MKVLITGAAGFIGGYLVRHCIENGGTVLGVDEHPNEPCSEAAFVRCDVRDARRLSDLMRTFRPERIFHLAAQSSPVVSVLQPHRTFDVNVGGTVNLFEALRELDLKPVVVVACSSAEYGGRVENEEVAVRESDPLRPLHPYGVSKVAQDLLAAQYFQRCSIPAIRMRIFNTTGPGKLNDVCSDVTRRAVEIELGLRQPTLPVGSLTNCRAIGDVRDLVRGLWLAAERGAAGDVYNIGATRTHSVQEVIDLVRSQVTSSFTVEQDPSLMRSCDERIIRGDINKFKQCTGWVAEIELVGTLRDMLDWWTTRLQSGVAFGSPQTLPRV